MSRLTSAAAVAFAAVFAAAVQAAAQPAGPFEAPPARVTRGPALTAPSAAPATEVVRAYLRARGMEAATVDSLELVSEARAPRTGVTHARFVQRAGGWLVYGVYLRAAIDSRGRLTSVIENLVPLRGAPAAATAGEGQALGAALRHLYAGEVEPPGLSRREDRTAVFERTPFFHRGPRVTAVALPVGNALRAGYLVETWSRRGNLLHHTVVGGDGAVLGVELRTNADSYNIFPRDPGKDAQTVVAGPGAGNAESPQGWLAGAQTTINIAGNNANAYLDANADNAADAGGTPVNDGNFLAAANLAAQPSTPGNKAVAVQNLFYLNNVIHDRLYRHGFTEAAGNFQENNFGAGGLGGDSVNAEAQDGSGTDNANFATPADGSNPRMQMFLWTGIEPDHEVAISSPSAATYGAKGAEFGPALDTTGLAAGIALANDGAGVTSDACDRMPRNSLAGVIALVDRGTCTFVDKALNVQRAGAIGMIVANNADTAIFTMGGSSRRVRIPSLMISLADGTALKASLPATGTIRRKAVQPLFTDSSLDSDIVWHEYGHGLTWRMIGNMSGAVSGAIGEGMSDVLAIIVNDDDRVAEYSASDPIGIRRAPYGNYPNSYADFEGASVHNDGEIYAAAIWRLWETFKANALDADLLLDYLVDGMNYTPAGPTYEQMRDGILAAVAAAGLGHECHVWRAFADYGIGQGSSLRLRGPNVLVTESFAVPAACTP